MIRRKTHGILRRYPTLMLRAALLAVALLCLPSCIDAQGCAQCRDNAAATPPSTQAAYRHAIALMVITAGTIFLAAVLLLKKHDHK